MTRLAALSIQQIAWLRYRRPTAQTTATTRYAAQEVIVMKATLTQRLFRAAMLAALALAAAANFAGGRIP